MRLAEISARRVLGLRNMAGLVVASCLLTAAAPVGWRPAGEAPAVIPGVWESGGYGQILTVGAVSRSYLRAGPYCYPGSRGPFDAEQPYRLVRKAGANVAVLAEAADGTHYVFRRLSALPAACAERAGWSRRDVAAVVASTFGDLYPGFGVRGRVRSAVLRELAAAGGADSDGALFHRLTAPLLKLDDAHVALADGGDREVESGEAATLLAVRARTDWGPDPASREREWSRRYRSGIVALLDGGGRHVANRRVLWGMMGDVGYLNIATMGAFTADGDPQDTAALDAALDEAFTAFGRARALIVDVSNNRGGYDAVGLRIAGRFADRSRIAYRKRAFRSGGAFQTFHVRPAAGLRFLRPVALLTSDVTVSAGETFTLAMKAIPTVAQVGARTRGALSDQLVRPLPNGWTLTLPAETYLDARGRAFEGVGVAPDHPRAVDMEEDHGALIRAVAEDLRRGRLHRG